MSWRILIMLFKEEDINLTQRRNERKLIGRSRFALILS